MNKKTIKLCILAVLGLLLCVEIFLAVRFFGKNADMEMGAAESAGIFETISWEEYRALSLEEQDLFFDQFDSREAFELWLEEARPVEEQQPILQWNKPGKLPNEYTWEEYCQLTSEERDAFFLWFDSKEAFEAWMKQVKPAESAVAAPKWNKPGKNPDQYTWEEYQKLTPKEQDAFFGWFGSREAFEAWMNRVKPAETTVPAPKWDKAGKPPKDYTWEEYQALTPEEQDAFYEWFGSPEAFEAWMEGAKPVETTKPAPVWNKPGKLPKDYTWEEYQALTPEEQDAFYKWFGSKEAFEAWMKKEKPAESTGAAPGWNKPGKLPNEYTWEEYQALTPEEQDAFFEWFESVEAFEAWMEQAKKN